MGEPRSSEVSPPAGVGRSGEAAWSAVLDDLEAGLAADVGDVDGPVWTAPLGLGPIPEALRARAALVRTALEERHAELTAAAVAVREELDLLAPVGSAARQALRAVHGDAPAPRLIDHDA